MRTVLLVLSAGLIAVGMFVAARATAPTGRNALPAVADTSDKAALGRSIREYLLANPEVLVEAMQELERKQDGQRDVVAQKAIRLHESELLRDPDAPIAGNPNGDVTIVDFNDYQCPYCRRAHAAVKSVIAADPKVKLVYKDLPILGEASKIAAFAALASRKQGKHAEFHDALMQATGRLDRDRIFELAGSVGLDVGQLQKDMEDPKIKQLIDRNMALASALGVRGTPAFVVGKQFAPGAIDAETLRQMVSEARKS